MSNTFKVGFLFSAGHIIKFNALEKKNVRFWNEYDRLFFLVMRGRNMMKSKHNDTSLPHSPDHKFP